MKNKVIFILVYSIYTLTVLALIRCRYQNLMLDNWYTRVSLCYAEGSRRLPKASAWRPPRYLEIWSHTIFRVRYTCITSKPLWVVAAIPERFKWQRPWRPCWITGTIRLIKISLLIAGVHFNSHSTWRRWRQLLYHRLNRLDVYSLPFSTLVRCIFNCF